MPKEKQFFLEEKTNKMCWAAARTTTKEVAPRLGSNERSMHKHIATLKDLPVNSMPPTA
jgi:predicted HTH transcriptional regulator